MSRKDIEEELQYQKLHGMPRHPQPQGGWFRKLFAIIVLSNMRGFRGKAELIDERFDFTGHIEVIEWPLLVHPVKRYGLSREEGGQMKFPAGESLAVADGDEDLPELEDTQSIPFGGGVAPQRPYEARQQGGPEHRLRSGERIFQYDRPAPGIAVSPFESLRVFRIHKRARHHLGESP